MRMRYPLRWIVSRRERGSRWALFWGDFAWKGATVGSELAAAFGWARAERWWLDRALDALDLALGHRQVVGLLRNGGGMRARGFRTSSAAWRYVDRARARTWADEILFIVGERHQALALATVLSRDAAEPEGWRYTSFLPARPMVFRGLLMGYTTGRGWLPVVIP